MNIAWQAGMIQKKPSLVCHMQIFFFAVCPGVGRNFRLSPHEYHVEETAGMSRSFCVCHHSKVEWHAMWATLI